MAFSILQGEIQKNRVENGKNPAFFSAEMKKSPP
jgi:hypothetical protein